MAAVETKLGKNRTEAEVKRFTEEKEKLEKEKDEIRAQLTQLRKERRELKEMLAGCTGKPGKRQCAETSQGGDYGGERGDKPGPEGSLHLHHQLQDHRHTDMRPAARGISAEVLEKNGP